VEKHTISFMITMENNREKTCKFVNVVVNNLDDT